MLRTHDRAAINTFEFFGAAAMIFVVMRNEYVRKRESGSMQKSPYRLSVTRINHCGVSVVVNDPGIVVRHRGQDCYSYFRMVSLCPKRQKIGLFLTKMQTVDYIELFQARNPNYLVP